jgi:nucleotidyltransferase substrate binding protein (TIGR01987 family)
MERLKERLTVAQKALTTLTSLPLSEVVDDVVRDAAIQRFEYTFEALWKAAQLQLRVHEGLEQGSPKGVVRSCLQVGILTEDQARKALEMVDDRNLTVHTYNEKLAQLIFSRLCDYAELMNDWLAVMVSRSFSGE